jgi:erythromycin esterase
MIEVRPSLLCASGLAAGVLVATLVGIDLRAAGAQQSAEAFEQWAVIHAVPIETVEPTSSVADLRRLAPMIGTARVVALGEPGHGAHEPLAFRNRLFRYLVQDLGFTAIAIESGLPESRRVEDFVGGGPGNAVQVVHDSLTWGFGGLPENAELVHWMREYNADSAHRHKLRFYGIDLSLGGPGGYTPTPIPFEAVLSFLDRVDRTSAERMRARLQPFIRRFPAAASVSFSAAEHHSLKSAIDDVISLLERKRSTYMGATSETDYAWAHRAAIVARQAEREFRVAPSDSPSAGIPPAAWQAATARDKAMAENVRWVLAQEGPAARVLVFAHNAHIKNAGTEGGIWSSFARAPNAMGMYLRSTLRDDLLIIGTSSAANASGLPAAIPDPGGLDAALGRLGLPHFVLDLRPSRTDRAVTAWLAEPRALRANFTTYLTLSPVKAFDALLFINALTRAHIAPMSR